MPENITVKLVARHTHAGQEYEPGAELSVSRPEAEWMLEHRVIEKLPGAKKE